MEEVTSYKIHILGMKHIRYDSTNISFKKLHKSKTTEMIRTHFIFMFLRGLALIMVLCGWVDPEAETGSEKLLCNKELKQ